MDAHSDSYGEAKCPLCGAQLLNSQELEHHLLGGDQDDCCPVTQAAFQLAQDYWQGLFEAPRKPSLQQRILSEDVYIVTPNGEPQLADSGLVRSFCRSAAELRSAEARISTFGFTNKLSERVKMFVKGLPGFCGLCGSPARQAH